MPIKKMLLLCVYIYTFAWLALVWSSLFISELIPAELNCYCELKTDTPYAASRSPARGEAYYD